ncbi:sugar ABC transporter substrate-binding protein [Peribacillus cavernae]|uniref:Sugar ABC transporter substrate-binding protein n=1 Tax=Peribacillus cavernae TaxID=1674310 RepID=A0A3S0W0R6_9BACI|nr:substrate-binding domain-containing protein [Peribacillus cavernae]MDQ0217431.1 ribose transport system substrate-binding protein [Peribacillus cavernae]RUQ30122.1 sugar ABC transporter substrate-binding protein [Peribacillus cavernae]
MKKLLSMFTIVILIGSLILTGCIQKDSSSSENKNETSKGADSGNAKQTASSGPITISSEIPDDQEILSKGPNGEKAVSAKTLQLTKEDVEKIKAGNYKAAIVMHYAGNDWSTAQINGLKSTFKRMGIKVIAVTDAQFKVEKQVSDIETVLAKSPDLIVSIPVDPVSTADAYKRAAKAGVKLVFMDNPPAGLKAGKDYVSVVSADNYGNGVAAADIMAKKLGGKGNIGVIYHAADFFVTKQRTEAFEKTIKEKYPHIKITERDGITDPNKTELVASGMLTRNPHLDGIFSVWDVPAEGVLSAARIAAREDLVITTIDLGTNVALEIALDGIVKGLGAQLPYDQGVTEAILAGYSLLDKKAPGYVAVPSLSVTEKNVLDAWQLVYREEAPETIRDAAS